MTTAAGIWAWHNNFNTLPLAKCVERAQRAKVKGVIVKWGFPVVEQAYRAGNVPWATERYVYINTAVDEANRLANAVDVGARFAVINAEEGPGGWGPGELGGQAMTLLIDTFRVRHPKVPLYASIDTRGDRLSHPYQRVALERCDGIMPMIYPGAFYPGQPDGYIERAIFDCLGEKDFRGKPVFPTLQSYSWEWPKDSGQIRTLGAAGISRQAAMLPPGTQGFQFYTIHHATDAEWDAVCLLVAACNKPPLSGATELQLRAAYMGLAWVLLGFKPDSLQNVVNAAAVWFGTRPTV